MLLAAGAEDLAIAMRRIRRLAYVIGRHADSDRPRGGPEAVLLRQTQAMASTSRSSPTPPVGSCGPQRRYPARHTTSPPPAFMASSTR